MEDLSCLSGGVRASEAVRREQVTAAAPAGRGWKHVASGQVGGSAGLVAAFPLDTVKVRLQAKPGVYSGALDCAVTMVKQEGFLSLYRGLVAPVMGYGLVNAAAFGANGKAVAFIRGSDTERELKLWEMTAAGAFAGIIQSFVRSPVERIKTLMQVKKKPDGSKFFRGMVHCVSHTVRTQGPMALMTGTTSTIAREVMQYAVYFPIYELLKRFLRDPKDGSMSVAATLFAGSCAGMAQWLPPTYCVDVLKSRIQSAPPGTYPNLWRCGVDAYRAEGGMVFFRGLSPALLRAGVLHGPVFLFYELTMTFLNKHFP